MAWPAHRHTEFASATMPTGVPQLGATGTERFDTNYTDRPASNDRDKDHAVRRVHGRGVDTQASKNIGSDRLIRVWPAPAWPPCI
jgi:hypothetical protein